MSKGSLIARKELGLQICFLVHSFMFLSASNSAEWMIRSAYFGGCRTVSKDLWHYARVGLRLQGEAVGFICPQSNPNRAFLMQLENYAAYRSAIEDCDLDENEFSTSSRGRRVQAHATADYYFSRSCVKTGP